MRAPVRLSVFLLIILNFGCHNGAGKSVMPEKYNNFSKDCRGRNIIAFPDEFSESRIATGNFNPAEPKVGTYPFFVVVERRILTQQEFSNHLLQRRAHLKENPIPTLDILRLERKLSTSATLFRIQQVDDAYQSELHFLLGGNLVVVKLDSYENKFEVAEDRLIQFMSDFSITKESTVKGFCLGALTIQGNYSQESGSYYWRDNDGNTFDLEIDSFNTEDPRNLLQRMAGPDSLLRIFHIGHTVLRSGERTVAGMRAYEWLGWTNLGQDGDKKTFKFVLETTRPKGSRTTPSIKLTFDSAKTLEDGRETSTNLSDEQAMAIWDRVVASIQLDQ